MGGRFYTKGGVRTTTVYLGLGSNLGDRATLLRAAVDVLVSRGVLRAVAISPLYETDAETPDPQPAYLNAVVRGDTDLSAQALLEWCLRVEAELGRVRPPGRRHAPRTVDIDVLLYGNEVIDTTTLCVPHPRLLERAFVRIPLSDVAVPGLKHPTSGVSLTADALGGLGADRSITAAGMLVRRHGQG